MPNMKSISADLAINCFFSLFEEIAILISENGDVLNFNQVANQFFTANKICLKSNSLCEIHPLWLGEFLYHKNTTTATFFEFELPVFSQWNLPSMTQSIRCKAHQWNPKQYSSQYILVLISPELPTIQNDGHVPPFTCSELVRANCLQTIQENEYWRFANDLHDSIGQQLAGLRFFLSSFSATPKLKIKRELLFRSQEILDGLFVEIRRICFNLRPRTLENQGLRAALFELQRNLSIGGLIQVDIDCPTILPDFNYSIELAVFRIVQEFVSNTLKHAKANQLNIRLTWQTDLNQLHLKLCDNGVGFPAQVFEPNQSYGLNNIRSRVLSNSGKIEIFSDPKMGSQMNIIIPIGIN